MALLVSKGAAEAEAFNPQQRSVQSIKADQGEVVVADGGDDDDDDKGEEPRGPVIDPFEPPEGGDKSGPRGVDDPQKPRSTPKPPNSSPLGGGRGTQEGKMELMVMNGQLASPSHLATSTTAARLRSKLSKKQVTVIIAVTAAAAVAVGAGILYIRNHVPNILSIASGHVNPHSGGSGHIPNHTRN